MKKRMNGGICLKTLLLSAVTFLRIKSRRCPILEKPWKKSLFCKKIPHISPIFIEAYRGSLPSLLSLQPQESIFSISLEFPGAEKEALEVAPANSLIFTYYHIKLQHSWIILFFDDMQVQGVNSNSILMFSVLSVGVDLVTLEQGKHIHIHAKKMPTPMEPWHSSMKCKLGEQNPTQSQCSCVACVCWFIGSQTW